jgi:hypothetical protein
MSVTSVLRQQQHRFLYHLNGVAAATAFTTHPGSPVAVSTCMSRAAMAHTTTSTLSAAVLQATSLHYNGRRCPATEVAASQLQLAQNLHSVCQSQVPVAYSSSVTAPAVIRRWRGHCTSCCSTLKLSSSCCTSCGRCWGPCRLAAEAAAGRLCTPATIRSGSCASRVHASWRRCACTRRSPM